MPSLATASDLTECVQSLIPITQEAQFRTVRKNWGEPYVLVKRYLIFPVTRDAKQVGFYVYVQDRAFYFDHAQALNEGARVMKIVEIAPPARLIAQPDGSETLTINLGKPDAETALFRMQETKIEDKKLWAPLKSEYKLRRDWIKDHNLAQSTFRKLSVAMATSCKGIEK